MSAAHDYIRCEVFAKAWPQWPLSGQKVAKPTHSTSLALKGSNWKEKYRGGTTFFRGHRKPGRQQQLRGSRLGDLVSQREIGPLTD